MCIRDSQGAALEWVVDGGAGAELADGARAELHRVAHQATGCLLYTSDAADERSSVDLGGRRIIKKKQHRAAWRRTRVTSTHTTKER